MSDQREKLERRLQHHRSSADRTALLEARLRAHRSSRASQVDRHKRLERTHAQGTNELFWSFAEDTPEAATRWDEIGALDLLARKKVTPAIAFSSGVVSLDCNLGGGVPAGFVEIYGEESCGKTTLLVEMIQGAQEKGHETALCPSEFVDLPYFEKLGVDLSKLVVIRGPGEEVLEEAGRFISEGKKRALFIDSATGLRPYEDRFGNWRAMLGSWLLAVHPMVSLDSAVVITNQVRARLSSDPAKMFAGGTDSTAARIAGMFDCRMSLSRVSVMENTYDLVIDIVANTIRRPAKVFTVPVVKGKGIDVWLDLVRVASAVGVLGKSGSWYYYEKTSVAQGEEEVARLLENNKTAGSIVLEDTLRLLRGVEG